MQVQHKMYILFRLLDEFLVLVIRSPRSLLAIEHSPGHVGPLNKPDQRLTTSDIGGLNSGSGCTNKGWFIWLVVQHMYLPCCIWGLKFIPGHKVRQHQRNGREIWQGKGP